MERAKQQQLQPNLPQGSPASSSSGDVTNLSSETACHDINQRGVSLPSSETDLKSCSETNGATGSAEEDQHRDLPSAMSQTTLQMTARDQATLLKVGLSATGSK